MARGRVGGTKSKIRGQIGDQIYQVRRSNDGDFEQIVMAKGERTEAEKSELLQVHRMVTCVAESAMRDLKPVGMISMQGHGEGLESLNAFSRRNIRLIRQDVRDHWYQGNRFLYPDRRMKGQPNEQLGGRFLLSYGSGQIDAFDRIIPYFDPSGRVQHPVSQYDIFSGVQFDLTDGIRTVGDFLKDKRITRSDIIVFVVFHDWLEPTEDPETDQQFTRYSHVIARINPDLPDDTEIDEIVWASLFLIQSDWRYVATLARDRSFGILGTLHDTYNNDAHVYFWGAFTISCFDGQRKIKTAYLADDSEAEDNYLADAAPADVFGSWMDQGAVRPWPSPFDNE